MSISAETSPEPSVPDWQAAGAPGSTSEPPARAISLVLAGHHPLTLCGLSQVFEKEQDCAVLAVYSDAESVVEGVRRHQPDIVILDLESNSAFTVLRRLERERLSTRVVVLASAADNNEMADAVRLGARAVLLKELPPEAFITCVRRIYRGDQSPEGHSVGRLVSRLSKGGTSIRNGARKLTPREMEIARLAAQGVSTRDIAARLDVKQGTVKIHLHSIYDKLNVGGRLGLVLFARRHDLA